MYILNKPMRNLILGVEIPATGRVKRHARAAVVALADAFVVLAAHVPERPARRVRRMRDALGRGFQEIDAIKRRRVAPAAEQHEVHEQNRPGGGEECKGGCP